MVKFDVWCLAACGLWCSIWWRHDIFHQDDKNTSWKSVTSERYSWSLSFSSHVLFKLGCVEDISWKNSTGRTICLAMADWGKLPPRLCAIAQKANRLDLDDSLILKIMSLNITKTTLYGFLTKLDWETHGQDLENEKKYQRFEWFNQIGRSLYKGAKVSLWPLRSLRYYFHILKNSGLMFEFVIFNPR